MTRQRVLMREERNLARGLQRVTGAGYQVSLLRVRNLIGGAAGPNDLVEFFSRVDQMPSRAPESDQLCVWCLGPAHGRCDVQ